jgi:hypothetical protein
MMYVVGSVDENEIMLYNVILAVRDSLHLLFKYVPPYTPLATPKPRFWAPLHFVSFCFPRRIRRGWTGADGTNKGNQ